MVFSATLASKRLLDFFFSLSLRNLVNRFIKSHLLLNVLHGTS